MPLTNLVSLQFKQVPHLSESKHETDSKIISKLSTILPFSAILLLQAIKICSTQKIAKIKQYGKEAKNMKRRQRIIYLCKQALMNSCAIFEQRMCGSVAWVAILNKAAIGSYSAQGGFVVNISITVQPTLLKTRVSFLMK